MRLPFGRLWPDTIVGRSIAVLLAGLILSQLAGIGLFALNRIEMASDLGNRQIVDRIVSIVRLVEQTPADDRVRVFKAMDMEGMRIGWGQIPLVPESDGFGEAALLNDEIASRLNGAESRASMVPRPVLLPPPDSLVPPGPGMRFPEHPQPDGLIRISVHLADGTWLNFATHRHRIEPLWRPRFFAPLVGGLLVVITLSVLAVRWATRPLAAMAAAAQQLGRDVQAPPMEVEGPREVREAALAFNEMQTRLRRFIEDRTQMIAAISHDLRTPITRLKLRAEFIDDEEQRARILADLDEMEEMIGATLAFARDDAAREPRRTIDLGRMLADLATEFEAAYEGPASHMILAGSTSLKRAFANLLDNARKYGVHPRLGLECDEDGAVITIDDDGPGLPPAELERVFAPFYRVETSRNRETGGTGLGLSVARSALRAHGGDVILSNRPEGGLRARCILPE